MYLNFLSLTSFISCASLCWALCSPMYIYWLNKNKFNLSYSINDYRLGVGYLDPKPSWTDNPFKRVKRFRLNYVYIRLIVFDSPLSFVAQFFHNPYHRLIFNRRYDN